MDAQKVDMFMMTMSSKFPSEKQMIVREKLLAMDDNRFYAIQAINYRDPTIVLVVSLVGGGVLGIDRFLIGDIGLGVLKLLTAGCCGIFTLIDYFLIMNRTKETNFQKFMLNA